MVTAYVVTGDDGVEIDARFEIENAALILHSRGGAKSKNAVNSDYSQGLRLLLRRLQDAKIFVEAAWVDSSAVQALPLEQRQILSPDEGGLPPELIATKMSQRMQQVGQPPGARGGNSTKRVRISLSRELSGDEVQDVLRAVPLKGDFRSQQRLPVDELNKVNPEHVWKAVQLLLDRTVSHQFDDSTDFDLIAGEGVRLPPKAVFGVAARLALGFDVLPRHFTGGEGSVSFRILRQAGFRIVPKNEPVALASLESAEYAWTEGKPKLIAHVKRERASGLAQAKKHNFKALNGILYCERCGLDPVAVYGTEHAEACIEVHHNDVHVKDMAEGHVTKLESLQCLCANCHRLVHRLIRVEATN